MENAAFPAGTVSAQGYLTGQELSVTGSSAKLYTAHYYDLRGRVTKTVQSNLLGGYDLTETAYTFTDNPATVTHTHSATGQPGITEVYTYTYDAADRLSKVQHRLGSSAQVTLADYPTTIWAAFKARACTAVRPTGRPTATTSVAG